MREEIMSQFLVPGDVIIHERRKYEVMSLKTIGDITTILYKRPRSKVHRMFQADKSHFWKVISFRAKQTQ